MSIEKIKLKTSDPEALKQGVAPEILLKKTSPEGGPRGSVENTKLNLNPENNGLFDGMSEFAKDAVNGMYEILYEIPVVNRVVGKLEIAYNQFWLERHEKKAVELKGKVDAFDIQTGALDQAKQEMGTLAQELKRQKLPGAESLMLKATEMDRQKAEIFNKKNNIQSKLESRNNETKIYADKRDVIANRLSGYFNEKLRPIERELEVLNTYKDKADLLSAVTDARHNNQLQRLAKIEIQKNKTEDALRAAGQSESEIKNTVAVHEKLLKDGREKIRLEKEEHAKKLIKIKEKIADVDAEANPYRDKRDEFIRVKDGRPLDIEIGIRNQAKEFKGKIEDVRTHKRGEPESVGSEEVFMGGEEVELAEQNKEHLAVSDFILKWDKYLKAKGIKGESIIPVDFSKFAGLGMAEKFDFKDLKNILGKYYKYRKIPLDNFNRNIDAFYKETIKTA